MALCLATSANATNSVSYEVTDGNLYFDAVTGTITDCDTTVTRADIPSQIGDVRVTSIGDSAFRDCSSLTDVVIPDSVTSIKGHAFQSCSGLTNVTIGNSVAYIGDWAFYCCSSLTDVTIGNSVTSIGYWAFAFCSSLMNMTGGNSVPSIQEGAFNNCSSLTDVVIPNSVTSIGKSAFASCIRLTNVTIGDGVTSIGDSAFRDCSSLTDVVIPDSVTSIKGHAFQSCSKLTNVTIGNSVTSVADWTFYCCSNLTDVTIPNSVTYIGYWAFASCSSLKDVYYSGTTEQWNAITVDTNNKALTSANIHYNGIIPDTPNTPDFSTFERYTYHANWLLKITEPTQQTIQECIARETPSAMYVKGLQETSFDEALTVWKAMDALSSAIDDITSVCDLQVEQKDIYSAIIMDALETSVSFDILDGEYESALKDTKKFVSEIQSAMKTTYRLEAFDVMDFQNLNIEQREFLTATVDKWFKKNNPDICDINDALKSVLQGFKIANSLSDYYSYCVSTFMLYNLTDSMKAVVSQLYKESLETQNLSLKLALLECVQIINSSQEELYVRMAEHGAVGIGVGVGKYLIGEVFWDDVKSHLYAAFPAIPALQAIYSGEKYLVNMAFSVDDLLQQYLKMKSTVEIERLMDKTYVSLRQSYVTNRTVEVARAFINAHDVLFKLRDVDCKQAYKFSDVVNDAVVNQVKRWFGASDNSALKGSIRSLQMNYAEIHRSAMVYWAFYLDEDYPDSGLSEQYSNLVEESREALLKREFLAACPVDVYVYDGSNQLVASVVDGRIFNNADIMVALLGDTKIIRFYDDQNYRIEYAGTDDGKMDVTISEFDENEDVSRTVNYYDVNLTDSVVYDIAVDHTIEDEKPYELRDTDGATLVSWDYDSALTTSRPHTVSVDSGMVSHNEGTGVSIEAVAGETLTLNASVPRGYEFTRWEVVSGNISIADGNAQSTSFVMTDEDVSIRAVLRLAKTSIVSANCGSHDGCFTANVSVSCAAGIEASAYCSFYDVDGRMLEVQDRALKAGENNSLVFETNQKDAMKSTIFVIGDNCPQCASMSMEGVM